MHHTFSAESLGDRFLNSDEPQGDDAMNKALTLHTETDVMAFSFLLGATLSAKVLAQQNTLYRGTGGVSDGNRDQGFSPAFLDQSTGVTYLSRFADGRVAPFHMLDGLPDELLEGMNLDSQVRLIKNCVVAGFLRGGLFYTREQAAEAICH